jgi:gluconokinase
MVIVLMGPAGAGKSTVGHTLAARLGWKFAEADDFHMPAHVAKMGRGEPLSDDDRLGWLDLLRTTMARAIDRREPLVLACSALAARHRAHLAGGLRGVRFVYLKADRDVLTARLLGRPEHFAKASLLDSQLATLQEPGDEALTLDGASEVDTIVGHIRLAFGV